MRYSCLLVMLFITMSSFGQKLVSSNSVSLGGASFKLYPNPVTNGVVYISTPSNGYKHVIIYDVFGEVVMNERIQTKSMNISRLSPGVYVFQLIVNKKTMNRKLVVK